MSWISAPGACRTWLGPFAMKCARPCAQHRAPGMDRTGLGDWGQTATTGLSPSLLLPPSDRLSCRGCVRCCQGSRHCWAVSAGSQPASINALGVAAVSPTAVIEPASEQLVGSSQCYLVGPVLAVGEARSRGRQAPDLVDVPLRRVRVQAAAAGIPLLGGQRLPLLHHLRA